MRIKLLLFFLIAIISVTFSQSAAEAERLFNARQYSGAKKIYEQLLKSKSTDPLYSYRLARCHYELKEWKEAILNFEISGTRYPLTQWYLAESFFNFYRFEEAAAAFENFIATLSPDDKRIPDIEQQKSRAETAARLLRRVEDIAIIDSVITDKASFLKKYDIGPELGTLRQTLLKRGVETVADKIVYTTQRADRQIFSDTLGGRTDIFSSFRLFDRWSDPVSVSDAVNSPANENYPFLLPDGLTLYFASDGENSIGGYDIFVTRYSSVSQGFLNPENVGFPFNSPANDYMMAIDELHGIGWFATDRRQPAGKVAVYKFRLSDEKIIFRTQNADTLHLTASLRMYRKVKNLSQIISAGTVDDPAETETGFSFYLTDETEYTAYEDFKNPAALVLWQEYRKIKTLYTQTNNTLAELRYEYENTQAEREKIADKILQKETELNQLILKMENKLLQVRNEEILFIRQKKQN